MGKSFFENFDGIGGISAVIYMVMGIVLYFVFDRSSDNVFNPLAQSDSLVISMSDSLLKTCPEGHIWNFQVHACSGLMKSSRLVFTQYFTTYNISALIGLIASVITALCLFLIAKDGWNGGGLESIKWVFGISATIATCGTLVPQVFKHENNVIAAANNYNQSRSHQFKSLRNQVTMCCVPPECDSAYLDSVRITLNQLGHISLNVPSIDISKIQASQIPSFKQAE